VPVAGTAVADAPEWWREPGRPGFAPGSALGTGFPWVLAGLARGAWGVTAPVTGIRYPALPGAPSALEPLAWCDSLEVSTGEGAGLGGYDAPLAWVRPGPGRQAAPRSRAMFHVLNGDFDLDETGLAIERGDSLRAMRVGAFSGDRGERGGLALAGAHLWGGSGTLRRGRHSFEGGYAQRGVASLLKGGEEEALRAESGWVGYGVSAGRLRAALSAARDRAVGESFLPARDVYAWSRRDAERNQVALEAGASREGRDLALRAEWSESRVRRTEGPAFDRRAKTLWVAARLAQQAREGTLEVALGAGHHDALDRWDLAPSAAYRFDVAPFSGRVVLERLLAPVWSDLAPGVAPFLQSTWVAGCEVDASAGASLDARVAFLLGTSRDRAIVSRLPLEEQWLRAGLRPDPGRYDFGLLTAAGAWRWRRASGALEGFALARDPGALQPAVDPSFGGRASAGVRFQAFGGDLDVTLRAEMEAIGPRESEAAVPRRLPGYASAGLAGEFGLGDARVTVRVRNLEDRIRPETWIDSATGREAEGVGREFRVGIAWRLFN
jgi:hypothetical protein